MSIQAIIKQGNVHTYNIRQNTTTYTLRIAHTPKGLWTCIQQSYSQWKLTITQQLIDQTVNKASGGKQTLVYKQFLTYLVGAANKIDDVWSIGIMTTIQLQLLKGGNGAKQSNSNKLYLILSNKQKKLHYPFTLILSDMWQKDKLLQAIRKMKQQLQQLKLQKADKSQSSFSILSQTMNLSQQMKLQNQQLKKKIKIYQQSLTQKRGAVEIDMILKEKNNLEIKAETKKRQENREIIRLRNVYQLMDREINQMQNEVDYINKQLMLLEDSMSNPAKLKSHAMRVLKSYENQLRTCKKVVQKQVKQIENYKRNILNSKNIQKRHLAKIKQIQQEIQQAKKKTNIKEISNRLHGNGSVGSRGMSSVASSQKDVSETSSKKAKSYTSSKSGMSGNLVRQNLLKKTNDPIRTKNSNSLMKTTPNIKLAGGSPNIPRKSNQYKPPTRPVVSSHQMSQQQQNLRNTSPARSNHSSIRSAQNNTTTNIDMKRKTFTQQQKQRQRFAIARLAGGSNNSSKNRQNNTNSKQSLRQKSKNIDSRKNIGASLGNKQKYTANNSNNKTQDILKKMKQVKAYYNSKVQVQAENNKNISAKIAMVTQKL